MAVTLGKISFENKQYAKAGQYLDTAIAISTRSGEKEKMVDALVTLAKTEQAAGDDASAENHLRGAVEICGEYYIPSYSWIAYYE